MTTKTQIRLKLWRCPFLAPGGWQCTRIEGHPKLPSIPTKMHLALAPSYADPRFAVKFGER